MMSPPELPERPLPPAPSPVRPDDEPAAVWIENQTRYPTARLAGLLAQALARQAGGQCALVTLDDTGGAEHLHGVPRLAPGPAHRRIIEGVLRARRERYLLFFGDRGDRGGARAAVGAETIVRLTERAPRIVYAQVERAGRVAGGRRLRVGGEIDADLSRAAPPLRRALDSLARAVTRRRVGVALSGGGAWGFAHCALLRGLSARGVPVDFVAGASFGSVVGALYAGLGLGGLDALVADASRLGDTIRWCPISTVRIERFVEEHLGRQALEDLEITFLPVAVDIDAAREAVILRGSVAAGVRASCAFPGLWGPALREGARHVDGCITSNVPVSCLVDAGADFVIASCVMMPPAPRSPAPAGSLLERWWARLSPAARMRDLRRSIRLLGYSSSRQQAAAADLAYLPDLSAFRITDFAEAPRIVAHAATQLGAVLDAAVARSARVTTGV